jgi:hypothetical protein
MNGIPQDLIFFLILAAILLLQILRERWRRRTVRPPAASAPTPQAEETEPGRLPLTGDLPDAPRVTPQRARALPAPGFGERHRFSRRALLGDHRSMQNAIVVAAILQPCRARRPHEVE